MHIGLCVPNTGSIHRKTVASIINLFAFTPHKLQFLERAECYVHASRRHLVKAAIAAGCDHVLFVDADMYFEGPALTKLLAAQKDIIGAHYYMRQLPLTSTLKMPGTGGPIGETGEMKIADLPDAPFPCYAVGTGLMLIDVKVFEKIPQPWFNFTYTPEGDLELGEDVWFCREAQKAGFEVWCDPTIMVRHMGDFEYGVELADVKAHELTLHEA